MPFTVVPTELDGVLVLEPKVFELFGERQIGQHRSEAARQVHHAPASITRDRGEIRRLCRRGGRHNEHKEGENGSHAQP